MLFCNSGFSHSALFHIRPDGAVETQDLLKLDLKPDDDFFANLNPEMEIFKKLTRTDSEFN